ncbi:hypothetical protein FGU65_11175 [Methanoculleus sp. FWC-SCC1]|uniref:Uncharacterized protein n=1 Tax=Methanoculleus frigidifontis TaxID=2584085 RepID=A0ABT8MBY4_9EURY|nr:hypothetical protein [Methanoculleus sp. FWC-SCC1]MDN7025449.1 hypothetical protein [Methanoculleus sp. FWC-SCC1]
MTDGLLACHPEAGSDPVRESSPGVAGTRGAHRKGTPRCYSHHVSSGIGITVPGERDALPRDQNKP